jgi:hypothetical protein
MYCATATPPHARYSAPDGVPRRHAHDFRPLRRLHRVPGLRDRLDRCAALTARRPRLPRSSVSPATRPASAPHATVVPLRRRCRCRLLIRGHHHLLSSPHGARGWAHPKHDTNVPNTCGSRSTAHTAFVASPRVLTISAPSQPSAQNLPPARTTDTTWMPCTSPTHALDRLQRCPTVCSEADALAQREHDAHHHHRTHHTRCSCSPSPTPLSSCPRSRLPTA